MSVTLELMRPYFYGTPDLPWHEKDNERREESMPLIDFLLLSKLEAKTHMLASCGEPCLHGIPHRQAFKNWTSCGLISCARRSDCIP